MIKLSLDEQNKLESLFAAFGKNDILYIIPRGHKHLPAMVDGGDVDIFINSVDFSHATSICKELGFQDRPFGNSKLMALAKRTVANPKMVVALILSSPKRIPAILNNHLSSKPGESVSSNYLEVKLYSDNLMVHLFNNLAYASPLNGSKIMVDPEIDRSMLEGRVKHGFLYVPSPHDELVHLICRGIFDYSGEFPDRYLSRCETLAREVLANKQQEQKLKDLLKLTFFKADDLVYEHIVKNQYTSLKSDLLKFSQY